MDRIISVCPRCTSVLAFCKCPPIDHRKSAPHPEVLLELIESNAELIGKISAPWIGKRMPEQDAAAVAGLREANRAHRQKLLARVAA